ncbi:MAG: NAD(P)H-dependent oxidoreductase [Clostridia bacterium]|nr:NAD(P)H-dependent oxidoreductase [Clostridia bacterium]
MKKILVILGHPDSQSFCGALAEAYAESAGYAGAQVQILRLGELKFDPVLWNGYNKRQELEPDLIKAQNSISWADHLVFVYPTWWAMIPSLLKGFLDRVLLPGFAYKSKDKSKTYSKLLSGRSAHLITTMDAPRWYYRLVTGQAGHKAMKKGVLQFCGIQPVRITEYTPINTASSEKRQKWLENVRLKGLKLM